MRSREFITLLGGAVATWPRALNARQQIVPVIGFLGPSPSSAGGHLVHAFQQGLRELGYVEGQNVVIEYRSTERGDNQLGDDNQLALAAAELVRLRVDVLVTSVTEAALAAKKATTTIPIVMVNVGDPVENGLVASLARPGGNVTGLSRLTPALIGKNLDLLKEAVPGAVRVAVLWNPANPLHPVLMQNVKSAARSLAVQLKVIEAGAPKQLERAFSAMAEEGVGAVLVLADGMFFFNRTGIAELALRNGLPSMFGNIDHVEAGGLMSYAANSADNYRHAATYVDKILKGARPADLPVQQPTKFQLIINIKTARALGLTVPLSLLARADEVIE